MGVINVTPDSFSDGGAFADADSAVKHGRELLAAGADLLDIGGESTRPGAERVSADEEWRRVGPVVTELAALGARVSIDTMRAVTAERALAAGAVMVNDVSGGRADPALPRLVASAGVPYVVMHWRGHSTEMQSKASYDDVVAEVVGELRRSVEDVSAAGVAEDQIVVDPGLGFAKHGVHNWELLARLRELSVLGRPVLVGASRKSFLGTLLADGDEPRGVRDRDDATTAITALAAAAGAWGVRVHDVRGSADAVRVVAAVESARAAVS
ncbi:MAG: dihydropteroate synthase [Frankiaceae bacterium]|nr:dihydropteroate synthase [Frankiaceae bacterium]MBV9369428.1 dihydropteroate synthase [Frankiales bacterium]